MNKTPVTLITGFLGSGKTTLLANLLAHPGLQDTAVIINEFGEVSIDHLIVAQVAENVVELRNGCICCTIRGDLAMTLRDLFRQRQLGEIARFKRVVVETTGLADPVPLVHTMMETPAIRQAYHLDGIVSVVDAINAPATLAAHDMAGNQLALADIIVVSKTDLADADTLAHTHRVVDEVNRSAERIVAVMGAVDPVRILGRGLFEAQQRADQIRDWLARHHHHDHSHGAGYMTHVITHAGLLSLAGTSVFLNHVVNEQRDRILRIKGIAGFREKGGLPGVVHAVQNKFYPIQWLNEWPDPGHTSRLVFIGRKLDAAWLDAKFAALCV